MLLVGRAGEMGPLEFSRLSPQSLALSLYRVGLWFCFDLIAAVFFPLEITEHSTYYFDFPGIHNWETLDILEKP